MIRNISFVGLLIGGVVLTGLCVAAIISGFSLASDIDNAKCTGVIVDHTVIDQTSDGFLGTETLYFVVTKDRDLLELLPNNNLSAISDWHKLSYGDVVEVRASNGKYVTCDYPKMLGFLKVFRK